MTNARFSRQEFERTMKSYDVIYEHACRLIDIAVEFELLGTGMPQAYVRNIYNIDGNMNITWETVYDETINTGSLDIPLDVALGSVHEQRNWFTMKMNEKNERDAKKRLEITLAVVEKKLQEYNKLKAELQGRLV